MRPEATKIWDPSLHSSQVWKAMKPEVHRSLRLRNKEAVSSCFQTSELFTSSQITKYSACDDSPMAAKIARVMQIASEWLDNSAKKCFPSYPRDSNEWEEAREWQETMGLWFWAPTVNANQARTQQIATNRAFGASASRCKDSENHVNSDRVSLLCFW